MTLLELMLVVTIAGILLGIGIPAMGHFIRSARITRAANDVMAGLHFTRSEAIKRRLPVTLCTSAVPLAADPPGPVCTASAFLTGWIAFVDDNGDNIVDASDGDGVRDPGELVLQQREAMPNTIIGRSTTNPLRITYLNTGFALNANQSLVLCDERGNVQSGGELSAARGILISVTGRAGVTLVPGEIQTLMTASGACTPGLGTNRLYTVSAFSGAPVFDRETSTGTGDGDGDGVPDSQDNDDDGDGIPDTDDPDHGQPDSTDDRDTELSQGGIAPEVVWLFPSPEDPVKCVGAECRPPPQCLVGLENCGVGINLSPIRTFWRQTGSN